MSYSRLISGLTKANITVDRKILADIAVNDPTTFGEFVTLASTALDG